VSEKRFIPSPSLSISHEIISQKKKKKQVVLYKFSSVYKKNRFKMVQIYKLALKNGHPVIFPECPFL
ncbi:hypothetical protein, partial [Ruminococcus sp.]